jgi:hypothetical protein
MQADAATAGERSVTGEKSTTENNQTSEILKKEFLKKLITNFEDLVVNFLDKSARDAIKQQQEITDEKEFCRIKLAIENRVLDLLINDSSLVTVPVVGFFRQVVGVLANRYPYMFLEDPAVTVQGIKVRLFDGKGTGGLTGIKSLPKTLQQKFSRQLEAKHGNVTKKRKRDPKDENSQRQVPRKKKKVYGILNDKYYPDPTEDQERFLGEVEYLESIEEGEAKFSTQREDLQNRLVKSMDIFTAVPGFFSSVSHAEKHFKWLTGTDIAKNIETGLPLQFKIVQCVVKTMCSTKEFRLNLEIAKLKGSELNGSIIPEFICLLRQLNMEWHNMYSRGLPEIPWRARRQQSPHLLP